MCLIVYHVIRTALRLVKFVGSREGSWFVVLNLVSRYFILSRMCVYLDSNRVASCSSVNDVVYRNL